MKWMDVSSTVVCNFGMRMIVRSNAPHPRAMKILLEYPEEFCIFVRSIPRNRLTYRWKCMLHPWLEIW